MHVYMHVYTHVYTQTHTLHKGLHTCLRTAHSGMLCIGIEDQTLIKPADPQINLEAKS